MSAFEANGRPRWRRVACAALAVLAAHLLAPSEARAGCGDPPDGFAEAAGLARQLPAPAPTPCQGPGCSQAPAHAPVVPSSAPTPAEEPVALSSAAAREAPPRGDRLTAPTDRGRPVAPPPPPEPPPRP